eukprot:TRINITY_DN3556_c0_g1_i1.p1 TRINITY_DN3556_c0_g1~~TRINITY_DN3556_c0_g1_i1.p1  ORF type:complete len:193 (+),score=28.36 TRINITY_DN3556_c0_g1_i1:681-1259(+)
MVLHMSDAGSSALCPQLADVYTKLGVTDFFGVQGETYDGIRHEKVGEQHADIRAGAVLECLAKGNEVRHAAHRAAGGDAVEQAAHPLCVSGFVAEPLCVSGFVAERECDGAGRCELERHLCASCVHGCSNECQSALFARQLCHSDGGCLDVCLLAVVVCCMFVQAMQCSDLWAYAAAVVVFSCRPLSKPAYW